MEEHFTFSEKMEKYKKLYRKVMLIFNLAILGFYTTFTLINISKDYGSLYTKILVVFLVLHIIISLLISVLKYFGNKKYISKLKDSVIIVNILKNILTLINLAMGVVALLTSFVIGDSSSTYSLVVMVSSIVLTILQILFSLLRIWFKKFMAKKVDVLKIKANDIKNNIKSKFSSLKRTTDNEGIEIEKEDK